MTFSMSASAKELRDTWRAHTASAGAQSHDSDARIGFAGSFTLDPLLPYLGAKLLAFGYRRPEFLNANFNQLLRVCRDPSLEFGDAKLDALVLLWRLEDLAYAGDPASVREVSDLFLNAVRGLREIFSGSIILALPPRPARRSKVLSSLHVQAPLQSSGTRRSRAFQHLHSRCPTFTPSISKR